MVLVIVYTASVQSRMPMNYFLMSIIFIDCVVSIKQNLITMAFVFQKYLLMAHTNKCGAQQVKLEIILNDESKSNNPKVQKPNQQKKSVPFNSSVERTVKIRPQTSIGPGSYNIYAQQKISNSRRLTPSYSLAKFKKINVAENQEKHELNHQESMSFVKEQKKTEHSNKNTKKMRKKDDFFGSTVGRFLSTQSGNCWPGPGAYDVFASNEKKNKKRKSKLAFGRLTTPQETSFKTVVSPFVVNVASVENKAQEKPVEKKNWNFGSHQPRFKDKSCQQPSQLLEQARLKICVGDKQMKVGSHNNENMKLKLRRNKPNIAIAGQKQKREDWRPLCYDASIHTISHKVGRKYQVNAPFNTQENRFAGVQKAINIIEDLLSQNKQNVGREHRGKEKVEPKGLMDSHNPRFDYKPSLSNISPSSYNPIKPARKQFNKLFL